MTFECELSKERFAITFGELNDYRVYETYMGAFGELALCRRCGEKDAHQVFECVQCPGWFRYKPQHERADFIYCPSGHRADG